LQIQPTKTSEIFWHTVLLHVFSNGTFSVATKAKSEKHLTYNDLSDQTTLFFLLQEQASRIPALYMSIPFTSLNQYDEQSYILSNSGKSDALINRFDDIWNTMHTQALDGFRSRFSVDARLVSPAQAVILEQEAKQASMLEYPREFDKRASKSL
jgi:hypothetical protein